MNHKRKNAFLIGMAILLGILFQESIVRVPPKGTIESKLLYLATHGFSRVTNDSVTRVSPQTFNDVIEGIYGVPEESRQYWVIIRDDAWNAFFYKTDISDSDVYPKAYAIVLGPDELHTVYVRSELQNEYGTENKGFSLNSSLGAIRRHIYKDYNVDGKVDIRRIGCQEKQRAIRVGREWLPVVESYAGDTKVVRKEDMLITMTFEDGEWIACEDLESADQMESYGE